MNTPPAFAQEDSDPILTRQLWLDYYAYYYFKPKWQFYGDVGWRTDLQEFDWMTTYARPSVHWYVKKNIDVAGGVGFWYTLNNDTINNFEFRPWQGIKFKWPNFKRIKFSHYFRLEERFNFPVDTWKMEFNLRFRYKLGLKSTLYSWNEMQYIFLAASVEAFADVGPQLSEKYSNRSRWSVGLGYRINNFWDLEFHYVFQRSRTGENQAFKTSDHLIQVKVRHYALKKDYRNIKHLEDY